MFAIRTRFIIANSKPIISDSFVYQPAVSDIGTGNAVKCIATCDPPVKAFLVNVFLLKEVLR